MAAGRPGVFEYELEAVIDYTFRRRGGAGPGYATIVGAGENATILHYVENNCAVADGDLVLVDAGCEYGMYTADVTRTWPANGRFTAPQREVYELVLAVQDEAVAMVRPGVTIDQIHEHCVKRLTGGMIALRLLSGTIEERITDLTFKKFFMHGTSHWLGMDVHDVGRYRLGETPRALEPDMVFTVEPGLYFAEKSDTRFAGIGVRIEDDVRVTAEGSEVLTAEIPKEPDELESLRRSVPRGY
jgi:Xaa-Pro aminopeptidase